MTCPYVCPEVDSSAAPHTVCNCAVWGWLCWAETRNVKLSIFGCRLQDKSDSEHDLEKRAQLRKLQRRLQSVSVKANMSAKAILHGIRQTGLDNILQQMHAWP